MQYRPDIDGLRAVAVLSVILFHIDKALLPGGFVGVDVFFVISGFLITGNIVQEIERGRFSVVEFYRRRVKRIAPVMLLVIAVTLLAAHLLMLPEDARATAKSAVWSLAAMANTYFWLYQDTGYFAADSAQTPLLHLWTLGVEEQFYILWPLILMALYRRGSGRVFMITAALAALASFFLAAQLFDRAPLFVYYMLPTRAGELLVGAITAIAVLDGRCSGVSPRVADVMAASGLALLAGSLFLLNERYPFPGWLAVPPTLGTAFLIFSGQCGEKRIAGLLSVKPLVWIGLISYSAYLWHWPLLAFYRYGHGHVGGAAVGAMLALTLLLAWASYRYVEQPARRTSAPAWQVFARQYIWPAGVVFVACLAAIHPDRAGIKLASEDYLPHDLEVVYRAQLGARLGERAAHASQPQIALEEALKGDLRGRDLLGAQRAVFLQLDQLVQPARPDPPGGDAPGGFVDDEDFFLLHEVVAITTVQVQCGERGGDGLLAVHAVLPDVSQAFGQARHEFTALVRQPRRHASMLKRVIAPAREPAGDSEGIYMVLLLVSVRDGLRQDKRHARFVDQHAVGFINDPHAQAAQQRAPVHTPAVAIYMPGPQGEILARMAERHSVAEVVERALLGCAIGDVARVSGPPVRRGERLRDCTHGEPERRVERTQESRIARYQIVVHGDPWTGMPARAPVAAPIAAASVLPSPVAISASRPSSMMRAAINCVS